MATLDELKLQREISLKATAGGPPKRVSNPFFGVGPITNMTADEAERRALRFEFETWLEENYRKRDDRGNDIGPFTPGEIERSMHRGYPADKIVLDMMREIHRYFEFPKENRMAVGLGGGHNGFSVAVMHLMNPNEPAQHVFVDTPRPETDDAPSAGFFRQSWGAQILELQKFSKTGDVARVHFAEKEGCIPSAAQLRDMGIRLFVGVGHETTGATTYSEQDVATLLEWIAMDPARHHAVLDGTSLLGAMPWSPALVRKMLDKVSFFMPFQKAIGGIAGYFVASFTPQAMQLIERNVQDPAWAIPRHLKLSVPVDARLPLSGERSTTLGPFYDPAQDRMQGGIINTFSNMAFAETTFGLLCMKRRIGDVAALNARSVANRQAIATWVEQHPLFELGVRDVSRRGTAVTLLKVCDASINDPAMHAAIIARSKQLLGYEGITHIGGRHEAGLDVARYLNVFPGTPGDYRAWVGGARTQEDIVALLDNIEYCYHRARIAVIEEACSALAMHFEAAAASACIRPSVLDAARVYRVLIVDLIGLKFAANGEPDFSEVQAHIEARGGVFHAGPSSAAPELAHELAPGKIHFFYQPDLSREDEILVQTDQGQYDAVIAAATIVPNGALFKEGGVRIGAGTGNMRSRSWGGGSGKGATAPLMNTPSFNSRATAHMVFKSLLRVFPDLPVDHLHRQVVAGEFDTGRDLKNHPTEKLEGKRMTVLGFGNIGREVAKIARAFGMDVVVYARPEARQWIESEGYRHAATIEKAARGADVVSAHLGLGSQDASTGRYANQGLIGETVIAELNHGAVIINHDRGELIDTSALGQALAQGRVRHASIDADIFVDAEGKVTGPMAPYLDLARRYPGKLELLPHAAADTEHVSRVEGAKQAVDQIFAAICYKEVVNGKGELPVGYTSAGSHTVCGVGAVSQDRLAQAADDAQATGQLRSLSEHLCTFWSAVASTANPERRTELIEKYGAQLMLDSNRFITLVESLGLRGPYKAGAVRGLRGAEHG